MEKKPIIINHYSPSSHKQSQSFIDNKIYKTFAQYSNNNNDDDDIQDNSFSFKFLRDLDFGTYIGLKFINITEFFFNNEIEDESKYGYENFGLLLYNIKTHIFTCLIPCHYTRGMMHSIFNSSYLNDD